MGCIEADSSDYAVAGHQQLKYEVVQLVTRIQHNLFLTQHHHSCIKSTKQSTLISYTKQSKLSSHWPDSDPITKQTHPSIPLQFTKSITTAPSPTDS